MDVFLLKYQSFQSWKDLKGKLLSPFLFLLFPPKQTRVYFLLFLFPSFPFPSSPFLSFLFSPKLLFKHSVNRQKILIAARTCFTQDELSGIEKQLLLGFSPDESYPLGGPLFMETPQPCSPLAQLNFQSADEVWFLDTFFMFHAFLL